MIEFLGFVPFEIGDSPGERIWPWRKIHCGPRTGLADRLGVDESTIYRWRVGETRPQADTRQRLERWLDSLPTDDGDG